MGALGHVNVHAVVCVAADYNCARFLLVFQHFLFQFKVLTVMLECSREETPCPGVYSPSLHGDVGINVSREVFFGLIKMLIVSCCNILAEQKGERSVSSYALILSPNNCCVPCAQFYYRQTCCPEG